MQKLLFEETKVKLKTINKLVVLQVVAATLLSLWAMTDNVFGGYWQINAFLVFIWSSIITGIVYLVASIRKVVKIFNSQTWCLLPIKSHNLFNANILSSLISIFYYLLVQGMLLVLVGLSLLQVPHVWQYLRPELGIYLAEPRLWQSIRIQDVILFLVLFALLMVFIYCLSITVNLTGNIVSSYLSPKLARVVGAIVKLSLIILAILVFINSLDGISLWIQNIFTSGILLKDPFLKEVDYRPLISGILLTLSADLILSVINIILLNKYSEAKA